MTDRARSLEFKQRLHNRYWWFQIPNHNYVPPIFALLSDEEWDIITQWYDDTDSRGSAGEVNIPCLSILSGFIEGNGVSNIVQLGHYEGFSTLLLGFMMRRMGFKHGIFSIDVAPNVTDFTASWVHRAGLGEYVKLVVDSSDAPHLPRMAQDYFGAEIATVFIDSSHQYQHTLRELDLWWPHLRPFGFVFMHDVSEYAASFDAAGEGGVARALKEWMADKPVSELLINEQIRPNDPGPMSVYTDGCGLAIFQKRRS
jgi:predicted O-methyltransferase YrrM